jgi:hypothetical protein
MARPGRIAIRLRIDAAMTQALSPLSAITTGCAYAAVAVSTAVPAIAP